MRRRFAPIHTAILILGPLLILSAGACGGESSAPSSRSPADAPASSASSALTLQKAPDSGQVDRVGPADGALKGDGVNDLSFAVEVDGPVSSIFLVAVDEQGKANGAYQADTLVGETETPKEVSIKWGKGTAGLGVVEGDKLLNAADGSLPKLGEGHHRIVLYISPSAALKTGMRLRVFVQRPDTTVVAGGIVTHN